MREPVLLLPEDPYADERRRSGALSPVRVYGAAAALVTVLVVAVAAASSNGPGAAAPAPTALVSSPAPTSTRRPDPPATERLLQLPGSQPALAGPPVIRRPSTGPDAASERSVAPPAQAGDEVKSPELRHGRARSWRWQRCEAGSCMDIAGADGPSHVIGTGSGPGVRVAVSVQYPTGAVIEWLSDELPVRAPEVPAVPPTNVD